MKKQDLPTEKVFFIKSGAAFGYGYAAEEFGLVFKDSLKDKDGVDRSGKPKKIPGMLSRGIVRMASDAEYDAYIKQVEKDYPAQAPAVSARSVSSPANDARLDSLQGQLNDLDGRLLAMESSTAEILALLKSQQAPPEPLAPSVPDKPGK